MPTPNEVLDRNVGRPEHIHQHPVRAVASLLWGGPSCRPASAWSPPTHARVKSHRRAVTTTFAEGIRDGVSDPDFLGDSPALGGCLGWSGDGLRRHRPRRPD